MNADVLRARFDAPDALGIGIEEELFLLDGETLDLLPHARAVIERVPEDPRFKLELPASQLEIVTPPCPDVASAVQALGAARRDLAAAAAPLGRLMTAGAHPTTAELGKLTDDPRYRRTLDEYGERARRQLVSGLHLHVSLGGAERTLAVYNAMRSHLPELAALAANAPVPRRPRHRAGVDPPDDRRQPAAPGRPARDPVLGVVRGRAELGRALRHRAGRAPLVVRAAPARDLRDARAARARRAVERRRRRGRRRVRLRADARAGGAPRRR